MRNKKNISLFTLGKNQTGLCGTIFPNSKLNYTNEILLWYTLFLILKKWFLKKNKTILFFQLTTTTHNCLFLKLITYKTHFVLPYQKSFYSRGSRHKVQTDKKMHASFLVGMSAKKLTLKKKKNLLLTKKFILNYFDSKKTKLKKLNKTFGKGSVLLRQTPTFNQLRTQILILRAKLKRASAVNISKIMKKKQQNALRKHRFSKKLKTLAKKLKKKKNLKFRKKKKKRNSKFLKKKKKSNFKLLKQKKKRVLNKFIITRKYKKCKFLDFFIINNKKNVLKKTKLNFLNKISFELQNQIGIINKFKSLKKYRAATNITLFKRYKQLQAKLAFLYKKKKQKKKYIFIYQKRRFGFFKNKQSYRYALKKRSLNQSKKTNTFLMANKTMLSVFLKKPTKLVGLIINNFIMAKFYLAPVWHRYLNFCVNSNKRGFVKKISKAQKLLTLFTETKKQCLIKTSLFFFCPFVLNFIKKKKYRTKKKLCTFFVKKTLKPAYLRNRKTKWRSRKIVTFFRKKKERYSKKKKIKKLTYLRKYQKKRFFKLQYLFLQKKFNYFFKNYMLINYHLACEIRFFYGVVYNTKIKRYIKSLLFSRKKKLYHKLQTLFWVIYKLLPFKRYNNISILFTTLKEIIGTKQRHHKFERRLVESQKKKKVKKPTAFWKKLNFIHTKMQIKKRKQAFLFFACKTLIKFMQPECLNFFMLQLKGKVNSKTRRSVLGLKHNFRGIQLYNSDSNVQLFYKFLAVRAKIGAFGLHFFGGIKIM